MIQKQHIFLIPEIYLIGATLYYWFLTANVLNPVAIVLLLVLVYQIITKNSISGLIISALFILLNVYMVLALISELSEFQQTNNQYWQLLTIGSLFLGINILVSGVMFIKYIRTQIQIEN